MLGLDFVNYMQSWQVSHYVSAEDFADKFNSLFSTLLLILCALIISAKQYVLQPLSCYCSKTTVSHTIGYVENYCWTTGVHIFNESDELPTNEQQWNLMEHRKINYYQWVPFVLGLQCALYYLPHLFWVAMVTNRLGSDAQYLVTEAASLSRESGIEKREQLLNHLANSVLHMQTAHREYRQGWWARLRARVVSRAGICFPSKRLGTALVFAYFVAKLLYLANCFGQLYLMHSFLGLGNNRYGPHGNASIGGGGGGFISKLIGWDLVKAAYAGRDWHTGLFPRSSLCRVRLFSVGMEILVCQCALPVNMLNEKVYMMLWLWTLVAAGMTAVSIPVWFHRVALGSSRRRFVRRQLFLAKAIVRDSAVECRSAEKFADNLLHCDGVFLFKMMQLNAGDVVTGQVLRRLYELWLAEKDSDDCQEKLCCGGKGGPDEIGKGDSGGYV